MGTANAALDGSIHNTPIEAWNYLRAHAGIEVDRRDATLTEELRILIDANQETLEEALSMATMEAFLGAFFQLVQPFVAIFLDILAFFEQAGATDGQGQWVLKVGNLDLDLEHFRKSIETMTPAGKVTLQVPAADYDAAWKINEILRSKDVVQDQVSKSFDRWGKDFDADVLNLPGDVHDWVRAYDSGEYRALPVSLTASRYPLVLEKVTVIADAAISVIIDLSMNRKRMMDAYRSSENGGPNRADALAFWSLTQNETDYWLRTLVIALSAALTLLSKDELEMLGEEMDKLLSQFPSRAMIFGRSFRDLESVLSLPIWKERYELYSVWVGTEVVRALASTGHDIEFHHDNGRIAFAFKETEIATIRSSLVPLRLISEKRSPLVAPVGHGRKANVQPDFGIWAGTGDDLECRMVVEVKHYLRSAKQRFVAVLEDYARALPKAEVYLVNYGPVGYIGGDVDRTMRDRCHTIEQLIPSHSERRKKLEEAVQGCVGQPIPVWPKFGRTPNEGTVLAFDVSSSMNSLLHKEEMEPFILYLLAAEQPAEFTAIDTSVRGFWPPDRQSFLVIAGKQGGATALEGPIHQLLDEYERILVVTDEDGLDGLAAIKNEAIQLEVEPPAGLFLRVCIR
jgi:hypothetical protein